MFRNNINLKKNFLAVSPLSIAKGPYVVQSLSFRRLINELDPAFIMPDEKGIKKVIYKAYNFTLPALIKKINDDAKSVSITTDMWTARNGQGYIGVTCSYIDAKFNLNEITLTVNYVRYRSAYRRKFGRNVQ